MNVVDGRFGGFGNRLRFQIQLDELERFLSGIKLEGECWIWTRGKNCHGYGKFSLRGEDVYAHRFSYAVFRGRINECYDIHHKTICKNKLCCNPWHLKKIKHDEHTINHNNTDDIPF